MTANQLIEFNQARDNAFISRTILPALHAEMNKHTAGTHDWEVLFHSVQECNKAIRAFEEKISSSFNTEVTA